MIHSSYIHITAEFVNGLRDYVRGEGIPLHEVVEVFAGSGELARRLGLPDNRNYSDSLLFAADGYEDEVNAHWARRPPGVVAEAACDTVVRFAAREQGAIRLLIMAAPLPAHSSFCPSYAAAKALHHLFGAQGARMIYIGEMASDTFASPKFYRHVAECRDERFRTLVRERYDSGGGYFTGASFERPLAVRPYLLAFAPCSEAGCDCRDGASVRRASAAYRAGSAARPGSRTAAGVSCKSEKRQHPNL